MTTNLESLGAAGGEGAGVVGNGQAVVSKLPLEGFVSAGVEGVVVEGVVSAPCTGVVGSGSAHTMGWRGESSTMARIDVEIMFLEAPRLRTLTLCDI